MRGDLGEVQRQLPPRGVSIEQRSIRRDRCGRRKASLLAGAVGKNVQYLEFLQDQIVGDDLAVALPPVAFRAHDGASALRGGERECVQRIEKRFRLRIIRVTPEERISPGSVAGAPPRPDRAIRPDLRDGSRSRAGADRR